MTTEEAERLRTQATQQQRAKHELAAQLTEAQSFAISAGLSSEAALIAKLVEAILSGTVIDLYLALTKK